METADIGFRKNKDESICCGKVLGFNRAGFSPKSPNGPGPGGSGTTLGSISIVVAIGAAMDAAANPAQLLHQLLHAT